MELSRDWRKDREGKKDEEEKAMGRSGKALVTPTVGDLGGSGIRHSRGPRVKTH